MNLLHKFLAPTLAVELEKRNERSWRQDETRSEATTASEHSANCRYVEKH